MSTENRPIDDKSAQPIEEKHPSLPPTQKKELGELRGHSITSNPDTLKDSIAQAKIAPETPKTDSSSLDSHSIVPTVTPRPASALKIAETSQDVLQVTSQTSPLSFVAKTSSTNIKLEEESAAKTTGDDKQVESAPTTQTVVDRFGTILERVSKAIAGRQRVHYPQQEIEELNQIIKELPPITDEIEAQRTLLPMMQLLVNYPFGESFNLMTKLVKKTDAPLYDVLNDYFRFGRDRFGNLRIFLKDKGIELILNKLKQRLGASASSHEVRVVDESMVEAFEKFRKGSAERQGFIVHPDESSHCTHVHIKRKKDGFDVIISEGGRNLNYLRTIQRALSSGLATDESALNIHYISSDRQVDTSNCSIFAIRDAVCMWRRSKEISERVEETKKEGENIPFPEMMLLTQSLSDLEEYQKTKVAALPIMTRGGPISLKDAVEKHAYAAKDKKGTIKSQNKLVEHLFNRYLTRIVRHSAEEIEDENMSFYMASINYTHISDRYLVPIASKFGIEIPTPTINLKEFREVVNKALQEEAEGLITLCACLPGGEEFLQSIESDSLFNKAEKIEKWISASADARKITRLNLANKGLKRLPAIICKFKKLSHLDLSQNEISRLPSSIAALPALRTINTSGASLQNVPAHVRAIIS